MLKKPLRKTKKVSEDSYYLSFISQAKHGDACKIHTKERTRLDQTEQKCRSIIIEEGKTDSESGGNLSKKSLPNLHKKNITEMKCICKVYCPFNLYLESTVCVKVVSVADTAGEVF